MGNKFHRDLLLDNLHPVNARVYPDIAFRDADTDFQVVENINKIVRVDSPSSYWALFSVGPVTWTELTTTGNDTLAEILANGNTSGGTEIDMENVKITNVLDPTIDQDAATKKYVDDTAGLHDTLAEVLANGNTSGGTNIVVDTGDKVTLTDAPAIGTDATNKDYVDGFNEFTELTDTPSTFVGQSLLSVQVNVGETALEFGEALGTQSDIALNTTHRTSAGTDHSDVVLNNTHRSSDGKDHSDVVLNNTHRASDGSDHSFLDQSVVSGSSPLFATQTPDDNSTKAATTEYVDDAVAGITISDISCKVKKSVTQTIPNNTATIATWNTETYDTDGMHDNVINNSRITIKTAGKYHFSCYGAWTNNTNGARVIDLLKNGTSMAAVQYLPTGKSQNTVSFVGDFAVNDYVEVQVTQDSGGNLNFLSGQRHFEAHKIN